MVRRVQRRCERPDRLLRRKAPALFLNESQILSSSLLPPVPAQDPARLLNGVFTFLNQEQSLGYPPAWNSRAIPSRLWEYNLHYFDWLWTLLGGSEVHWDSARRGVENWIQENPPRRGASGWEPYPISLRVINWTLLLFVRHRERTRQDAAFAQQLWESLWRQAEWLSRRLETHIQANHLLENVVALAVLGSVFKGSSPDRWLAIAKKFLRAEVTEQIPGDGMHYERSPMYHRRMLWLMEGLAQSGEEDFRNVALSCLPQMREALQLLRHPDGNIALLNDSAHGIYSDSAATPSGPAGVFSLPDAGYYGGRTDRGDYVVVDAGAIGPDHQPGHAHADFFSFELSLRSRRVIVDTGVHDYTDSVTRAYARSTAAHNTVELDGLNSVEVWSVFRVGRRTKPRLLRWQPARDGFILEAEHDGYGHLASRAVHRRRFEWRNSVLRIDDSVAGDQPLLAIGRLHFAPGTEIILSGSVARCLLADLEFEVVIEGPGTLQLSESDYYPEFGRILRRPVLKYQLDKVPRAQWTTLIKW